MKRTTVVRSPSNRDIKYECTYCHVDVGRDKLMAKRVQFLTMGKSARVLRSRTVAWVCNDCAKLDNDWTSEPWMDSPGLKDIRDAG